MLFIVRGMPYSGPIMWMPGSKPNLVNMGAPPMFSQCVLGTLLPVKVPCTVLGAPVGAGLAMSPFPGYGTSAPGCLF